MPLRILSADAAGRLDGTVKATILDRLAAAPDAPDATVVVVSNFPDFRFNPELRAVRGPVVVVDFMEYGADWTGERTHLFGKEFGEWPAVFAGNDGFHQLRSFFFQNPPDLYFKRELAAKDAGPRVRPIDWPAMQPAPPIQSRAEFDARPIEVFHCWGYSNPLRPKLHAAIFEAMATRGIDVLSAWRHEPQPGRRTWMSIYVPWQCRVPMCDVMRRQRMSKISVSLPGFGLKCFRHAEAPVGAVMAMTDDKLAWSFPWVEGENCLLLTRDRILMELLAHAETPAGLYEIYRAGQETIDRYRPDRYVNEYLLPAIREAVA